MWNDDNATCGETEEAVATAHPTTLVDRDIYGKKAGIDYNFVDDVIAVLGPAIEALQGRRGYLRSHLSWIESPENPSCCFIEFCVHLRSPQTQTVQGTTNKWDTWAQITIHFKYPEPKPRRSIDGLEKFLAVISNEDARGNAEFTIQASCFDEAWELIGSMNNAFKTSSVEISYGT